MEQSKRDESIKPGKMNSHFFVNNSRQLMVPYLSKVSTNRKKATVLIVEDNDELKNMIVNALSQNFTFITACNVMEGFQKSLQNVPDLIIVDLKRSVKGELILCHKLTTNILTSFIPVIVLTAKKERETENLLLLEYADAFISKPFEINDLFDRIIHLILKRRKMEEKIREREIIAPKEEMLISADEKFLGKITQLIEESLSDPDLNVALLCRKSGIGNKKVYRKIKELTGMSVVEYIRSIRLKKAAMFLRQQKLSITEILYLVGFSNQSYFTRCFKHEFGMAPKEFIAKRIKFYECSVNVS